MEPPITSSIVSNIWPPGPPPPPPPPAPPPRSVAAPAAPAPEWETPIMAVDWRRTGAAITSSIVSYGVSIGVMLFLAGFSILVYSAITAVSLVPFAGSWWIGGVPYQRIGQLGPIDSVSWNDAHTGILGMPGRVLTWWGCVLLVVGGSLTAFSLSIRPRIRAGR